MNQTLITDYYEHTSISLIGKKKVKIYFFLKLIKKLEWKLSINTVYPPKRRFFSPVI